MKTKTLSPRPAAALAAVVLTASLAVPLSARADYGSNGAVEILASAAVAYVVIDAVGGFDDNDHKHRKHRPDYDGDHYRDGRSRDRYYVARSSQQRFDRYGSWQSDARYRCHERDRRHFGHQHGKGHDRHGHKGHHDHKYRFYRYRAYH